MAATALNRQTIVGTGLVPSLVAANVDGNFVSNLVAAEEKTFLVVNNGGGSPITVTIDSQVNCDQGFDHDLAVAVTNGTEAWIGPLSKDRYNDSAGLIQISYSAITSVTVGVVGIP